MARARADGWIRWMVETLNRTGPPPPGVLHRVRNWPKLTLPEWAGIVKSLSELMVAEGFTGDPVRREDAAQVLRYLDLIAEWRRRPVEPIRIAMAESSGALVLRHHPRGGPTRSIVGPPWIIALDTIAAVLAQSPSRVQRCERCTRYFVGRGRQEWCSARCGTWVRVRRHRASLKEDLKKRAHRYEQQKLSRAGYAQRPRRAKGS